MKFIQLQFEAVTWLFSCAEENWCNRGENAAIHIKEWRVLIWQCFSLLFTHLVSLRPFNAKKDKVLQQIIKICHDFQENILAKVLVTEFTFIIHIQYVPPCLALLFPCLQENSRSNSKEANRKHEPDAYSQQIFLNHTGHYSGVEKKKRITPA